MPSAKDEAPYMHELRRAKKEFFNCVSFCNCKINFLPAAFSADANANVIVCCVVFFLLVFLLFFSVFLLVIN